MVRTVCIAFFAMFALAPLSSAQHGRLAAAEKPRAAGEKTAQRPPNRLAKETSVPPRRINEIVRGQRSVSADTALRLARYFGTSERFWLNLQARYDLEVEKDRLGDRLLREVKVRATD